jgi:putative redox protein
VETTVSYLGGVRFEASARGHRLFCDQPADNGGEDTGMAPPEFLLVSLGTCAAFYAVQYLRTRSLPAEGATVRVVAEKAMGPARLSSFRIEIGIPGLIDEKHRAGVLRAAKACLVHNTLLQTPSVEIELAAAAAV